MVSTGRGGSGVDGGIGESSPKSSAESVPEWIELSSKDACEYSLSEDRYDSVESRLPAEAGDSDTTGSRNQDEGDGAGRRQPAKTGGGSMGRGNDTRVEERKLDGAPAKLESCLATRIKKDSPSSTSGVSFPNKQMGSLRRRSRTVRKTRDEATMKPTMKTRMRMTRVGGCLASSGTEVTVALIDEAR
jgi:hypothetical protein